MWRGRISAADRPLVIGHRGALGHLPEHTAASFRLAIEQGVDAIEVDVVASADGVPVVRHERELGGTTDVGARGEFAHLRREGVVDGHRRTGWFAEDLTWADLQRLRARERMPRLRIASAVHDGTERLLRLAEVAETAAEADVMLVVELKEAALSARLGLPLPDLVLADLARARGRPAVVALSFERTPLDALRRAGAGWPLVYLLDDHGRAADLRDDGPSYAAELADPAGLARFDGVSLPTSLITPGQVALLHRWGLHVWTWTLRPENRFLEPVHRRGTAPGVRGDWQASWSRLLDAGVDGVFVDHPDLAVDLLEGRAAAAAAVATASPRRSSEGRAQAVRFASGGSASPFEIALATARRSDSSAEPPEAASAEPSIP